jgi:uncharacterized membrane protein YgdD (TMEM256/DUF423 family)
MNNTLALRIAALSGFLAVALGAIGAHSLKHLLEENHSLSLWEKAVFYHVIHTLMLFLLAGRAPLRWGPWLSFVIGIILFSGSLYLYALTRLGWLVAITPFGGVSFLVGWAWLLICPFGRVRNGGPTVPGETL